MNKEYIFLPFSLPSSLPSLSFLPFLFFLSASPSPGLQQRNVSLPRQSADFQWHWLMLANPTGAVLPNHNNRASTLFFCGVSGKRHVVSAVPWESHGLSFDGGWKERGKMRDRHRVGFLSESFTTLLKISISKETLAWPSCPGVAALWQWPMPLLMINTTQEMQIIKSLHAALLPVFSGRHQNYTQSISWNATLKPPTQSPEGSPGMQDTCLQSSVQTQIRECNAE